jgi:hypothetical protein
MEKPASDRPIGLRLTSEEHQRLRIEAAKENMTMASVAAREVRRYLSDRPASRVHDIGGVGERK